ncbi:hypothetical protein CCAX7_32590 [Capsulimonas corticalis]|uniref:Uncharacterized protein n=1 Tax=Capsulimonas corticalis TaxID=2219043 RepID=A0A402D428_9BACT|nr:AGE family epimerase/isomerase [Capsulimonas corticalis]BDI31208.1 hypothetical protein CCAX7_32590 [Capsulimonas corticalis]
MQSAFSETTPDISAGGAGSDAAWAASLLRSLLDFWLGAASAKTGIFYPDLDRQWRRRESSGATLVSQCRLIYNFSRGFEVFGEMRYAAAAERGAEALARYFARPDGGYCWAISHEGRVIEETLDSYGHAFAILALSAAAKALDRPSLAAQAIAAWRFTDGAFVDRLGGVLWRVGTPNPPDEMRSQNPIMHLFEALMALCAVDPSGDARQGAACLLSFMRSLPGFERGRLIECYDTNWAPLPIQQGGVLNIGHQFEWALLLSDWYALTGEPWAAVTGRAFLETALSRGVDTDGGVWEACDPDGRLTAPQKELWPQCEAIRAMQRYVHPHHLPNAARPLRRTLDFYQHSFVDPIYGGLFASLSCDGTGRVHDKGNCWKLDYHSVNMCLEIIALPNKHEKAT